MSLTLMHDSIVQNEIMIFLNFTDSLNFRKTAKVFNESYLYQHNPRLDEQFAIIKASKEGENNAVICLLKVPFVNLTFSAFLGAVNGGHSDVVRTLLESNRVDPAFNENIAVISAARKGRLDTVKLLLKDIRIDPTDQDNLAIKVASYGSHPSVVQALLDDGRVDPSVDQNYAIRIAAQYGHLEVVQILLRDDRVDPKALDSSALMVASRNGHVDVVKALLNRTDPVS
jgi:hypothetical protein